MLRVVLYGKGGIGKSTVAVHLSAAWREAGLRVLHVGCDPKMDSSLRLRGDREGPAVLDFIEDRSLSRRRPEELIVPGPTGVDTIEIGGPDPGVGCAGRGVANLFDWLEARDFLAWPYDVALFDVLGDLVCGGFVAPLRYGLGNRVVIVASAEPMALYAANNVCKALRNHVDEGVALAGIVFNVKTLDPRVEEALTGFAARLRARVLGFIPWSREVREAERRNRTVIDDAPASGVADQFRALAEVVRAPLPPDLPMPTPLERRELMGLLRDLEV